MKFFQRKEQPKRSIEEILTIREREEMDENRDIEEVVETEEVETPNEEDTGEGAKTLTENALDCFGWDESKTEKWLIKSAKFWYAVMSFGWFLLGAFTFAPVLFISQKMNVLFHDKKKSLFVATLIYLGIILLIVLAFVIGRNPES